MKRTSKKQLEQSTQAANVPNVAIIVDIGCVGVRMLEGISQYLHVHGPWNIYLERALAERADLLRHWRGQGIIARLRGAEVLKAISRHDVPTLIDRESGRILSKRRPPVVMESAKFLAGDVVGYFYDKGFRNFAFCPMANGESWGRKKLYVEEIKKAGYACHVYQPPSIAGKTSLLSDRKKIAEWLTELPKPIALMAANDLRASEIISSCKNIGIRVPEDIAVIGHDNDEVICNLCDPPLSSIEEPQRESGYRAAQMLDALMSGKSLPKFPPMPKCKIIVRKSTDIIASENEVLREALSLIHRDATRGLSVKELVQKLKVSRSTLERLFSKNVMRSPKDELLRVKFAKAKLLLEETVLPISEVARLSGFVNTNRLNEVFKRSVRQTSAKYRAARRH